MAALRLVLAAGFVALPLWVAAHTPAYACTCGVPPLAEQVQATDVIVLGRAEERQIIGPLPTPVGQGTPINPSTHVEVETLIAVEEYVKGSGASSLPVRSVTFVFVDKSGTPHVSEGLSPSCGYAPALGERYLFFVHQRDDGLFAVDGCGGSLLVGPDYSEAEIQDLIAQIRALLQEPTATSPPPPTATFALPPSGTGQGDSADAPWALIGAAAGGALLATAALSSLRRREG